MLIYLSRTDKTDPVDVSLSNHPSVLTSVRKREERIEKVLKREIGIDLIRYTAVSKFGHARRLNTLKWKEERRGSVGGLLDSNGNEKGTQIL